MHIKKAILTGGGRATRLFPITATTNKHLLPLAGKPMIFHAIEKVVEAGVTEIFINTNPGDRSLPDFVGDGTHWGITIKYFEQTGGPQGIAHVVKEAEQFIGNDPFVFYLSDNILLGSLSGLFGEFSKGQFDCMLALSEVQDPERFGVPYFDQNGTLVDVVEKPKNPPNNFAVTGIYLYGPGVFFDAFTHIEKSARGEYEISSIHSYLLKQKKRVGYTEVTGWWKDTGKADDLLLANRLLLDTAAKSNAAMKEGVVMGAGVTLGDNVRFTGPVMIGDQCTLANCSLGPYVTIGHGSRIDGVDILDAIVLDRADVSGDFRIEKSILGNDVVMRGKAEKKSPYIVMLGDKSVVQF
ncbi:MAG: sugar phosphate nucleotidyltransferase [Patescibacteria group bacterium]